MNILTTFKWVPPFASGFVCDLRLRWAFEEAALPYEIRLIDFEIAKSPEYRKLQPFGQVICFEDENVKIFETGAVLIHVAEKSEKLMPRDVQGRARAMTWIICALNTIEPHVQNLTSIDGFNADKEWAKLRRPEALQILNDRLEKLSVWLGKKEFLEDQFTAGDIMMTTVLRNVKDLSSFPNLESYVNRMTERTAFKKALADQISVHKLHAP